MTLISEGKGRKAEREHRCAPPRRKNHEYRGDDKHLVRVQIGKGAIWECDQCGQLWKCKKPDYYDNVWKKMRLYKVAGKRVSDAEPV